MLKVAVITRHSVMNYGSLLQTIAIQSIIETLGYDCEIVDYQRDDENYKKIADVYAERTGWGRNCLLRCVYRAVQSPRFLIMGKHFEKMRMENIKTTRTYHSLDELKKDKPEADILMTGSDQVWGPVGRAPYDPAYFLDFAAEGDWCVSYGASFGRTEFTDEVLGEMQKLLKKYHMISVREKSAEDIIGKMDIGPVKQVLDPTLLLDSAYWSKMVRNNLSKKYILVYQLYRNPKMLAYAHELAARSGLELVYITTTIRQLGHRGIRTVFLPSLGEWLGYIKYARFMITDSFHGIAFAINFNIEFGGILPDKTVTRIWNLLELTGLMDRVITDYHDFSIYDTPIAYDCVNKRIQEKRKESMQILREMLTLDKGI